MGTHVHVLLVTLDQLVLTISTNATHLPVLTEFAQMV